MDDGSFVDVAPKYDEWVVDSRCYTLEDLEKDIAARVNCGSGQQLAIFEYEAATGAERKLRDDNALSSAFAASQVEKKMFLFVHVEDKPADLLSDLLSESVLTEVMSNMVTEGGKDESEVTEITPKHNIIRHVVNLKDQTCTCREWQVSGKPCPHALVVITKERNPNMEKYLHPYFSVHRFRLAYAGVIRPLPDKSQWPHVEIGFRLLPPLTKRAVGRQRKNRIPSCLEDKGNKPRGKGCWQVQCKNCFQYGHRTKSPKCPLNGTKKRKSRAKKGQAGRPPGRGDSKSAASTPKRQKVAEKETTMNTSPGPVTRSQLASSTIAAPSTPPAKKKKMVVNTSPGPVTRSQLALSTTAAPSTPPAKKKMAVKKIKKITLRRPNN